MATTSKRDTPGRAPRFGSSFEAVTSAISFRRGIGLPGWVWEHNVAVAFADLERDPRFIRKSKRRSAGCGAGSVFRSALAKKFAV